MGEQILCEFCDEPARYTGVKFAGDHSLPTVHSICAKNTWTSTLKPMAHPYEGTEK
jgi:hypothetical protein